MSHISNLLRHVPGLRSYRVLDLGAGKGNFLVEAANEGIAVAGIEYNPAYVEQARMLIKDSGFNVEIREGQGEALPYADGSFEFVNASEVIEHVRDPLQVLREVYRVLVPGGSAYMSVPNRYGMRDPHYKLYGVNWLPRVRSDAYIAFFGRSKTYEDTSAGLQRLADMHYFTYSDFKRLAEGIGFLVSDSRADRIRNEYSGLRKIAARIAYPFLRYVYFDSFHLILSKPMVNSISVQKIIQK